MTPGILRHLLESRMMEHMEKCCKNPIFSVTAGTDSPSCLMISCQVGEPSSVLRSQQIKSIAVPENGHYCMVWPHICHSTVTTSFHRKYCVELSLFFMSSAFRCVTTCLLLYKLCWLTKCAISYYLSGMCFLIIKAIFVYVSILRQESI